MPRPKSDLRPVQIKLTPAHVAMLDAIAVARGLSTESGQPNRSAAARAVIEEAVKGIEALAPPPASR